MAYGSSSWVGHVEAQQGLLQGSAKSYSLEIHFSLSASSNLILLWRRAL